MQERLKNSDICDANVRVSLCSTFSDQSLPTGDVHGTEGKQRFQEVKLWGRYLENTHSNFLWVPVIEVSDNIEGPIPQRAYVTYVSQKTSKKRTKNRKLSETYTSSSNDQKFEAHEVDLCKSQKSLTEGKIANTH